MTGYYDRKNPEKTPRPKHPNGRKPPNPNEISPHLTRVRINREYKKAAKFDRKIARAAKPSKAAARIKMILILSPLLLGLWVFADVLFK